MAVSMVGNRLGFATRDQSSYSAKISEISADGVNTVTVAAVDVPRYSIGQIIDIRNKTTGVAVATARTVTGITSAGVITYSGADVAATPGTDAVYATQRGAQAATALAAVSPANNKTNFNGGPSVGEGFFSEQFESIPSMRAALTAIDATAYSSANLDKMTMNDMEYALRVHLFASTITRG